VSSSSPAAAPGERARVLGNALLAVGALRAVRTANAWHPVGRLSRASSLGFPSGLVLSELPLHAVAVQAAVTAGLVGAGALRTPRGRAGLALTAASWAGLLGLERIAQESADVLEVALVDGLGDDYRALMAPTFAPPDAVPITRRQVVNPVPAVRKRYAATRDIAYGEHGRRNQLDVWRRADLAADAKAPVLVQVHGGAWMSGNKEQQGGPLMSHLAERGWVCVAVNYRLSPRATWPDHIVDVKRALAWVKQNIAEHGGDPEFVVITGGSAGGHLSSLAALTPGVAAFQPGFEDADTAVQAAVPMYGVYDFTNRDGTSRSDMEPMLRHLVFKSPFADSREVWEQASSMSWVGPDAPPFMIVHGANDSLAPVEQARSFAAMLRVASNEPVVYAELPRAQHAFDILHSVRTRRTVEAIDRFLAVVRTEHAVEHPADAGDQAVEHPGEAGA
jgi:acetyl esterase/lipase